MIRKILSTPTEQLSRATRFVVFQIKLWSHCARLLKKNRCGQQAAALSYHTVFGIVPLAIVMLFIFQLFPAYGDIGERVKNLVYNQLHLSKIEYPDPGNPEQTIGLTNHIDQVVAAFFAEADKGTITVLSVVIVIWAALALLSTIEKAFNNIWHVATGRGFLHRIINYWALLTLGPLLLGVGIYLTTRYSALGQIEKTIISNLGPVLLSYLVATFAFFMLYFVLPNTKVRARSAIWGAAVAALVWSVAKWGFGVYVTRFIPYNEVYGVLGLVPLGVLWIFISWLIVLFGLILTFTTQHLERLTAAEMAAAEKAGEHFIADHFTAIRIVREIAATFEKHQGPLSPELLCSKLDMPAEFGEKMLSVLVRAGILARVSEPVSGFVPAADPEHIKLADISEAVAGAAFGRANQTEPGVLQQILDRQKEILNRYNVKQLLGEPAKTGVSSAPAE